MSEKIQISLGTARDGSVFGTDSNRVLRCHRPPKMSVPAATGDIPEDFVSKLDASCRRARLRSSVNTPRASGVQPFRTSCTPPKESVEIIETQTRLFAGSVSKSFLVENRYSRKRSLLVPPFPIEPLVSIRIPSCRSM